jgi:hypothetical protein
MNPVMHLQQWELFAAAIAAFAGVVGLGLRRLLPAGLGGLLCVGGLSAAAAIFALNQQWFAGPPMVRVMHVCAAMCLLWSVSGTLACRAFRAEALLAGAAGSSLESNDAHAPQPTFAACCYVAALSFGVTAAVLMSFMLSFSLLNRLFTPDGDLYRLPLAGAVGLLAIIAAAILWGRSTKDPHRPVVVLLLVIFLAAWWSLAAPPAFVGRAPPTRLFSDWWPWVAHLQASLALIVLGGVAMAERSFAARRAAAWPHRLERLIAPQPLWPGYHQALSVVAAAVLLLGTIQIVRGLPPSRMLCFTSVLSAALASAACFYASYSRWSPNLFGLGAALATLAAATAAALPLSHPPPFDFADRTPVVLNAVLYGLAFMTFIWFWLARFWDQQLLDGRPWTTAGRGIPYVWRTGFLVAALAVMIAFQMALWPRWPHVYAPDDATSRWAWGLSAILMLMIVIGREALRSQSTTVATLSVLAGGAAALFAVVRWADLDSRGWIVQHLPVVAALVALPVLGLAERLPRTTARPFAWPLWCVALLVLPACAMLLIAGSIRWPAEWVRPLTLAIIGALYGIAGSRESRRPFLILAAALIAAALFFLWRIIRA